MSEIAAQKVLKKLNSHSLLSVEDLAQEVLSRFYALSVWDRPKTGNEFEIWAFQEAKKAKAAMIKLVHRERPDSIMTAEGTELSAVEIAAARPEYMYASSRPMQLIRCDVIDALKMVGRLPAEMQRKVKDVIDCEDVMGYAKDKDVSLFEAMAAMKHVRVVMNRLSEDAADELKFKDEAAT